MAKLKYVNIFNMELINLEIIKFCINLENLDCHENKITNLHGLEYCTNLQILSCQSNQITNLYGLKTCINLRQLFGISFLYKNV